MIQWVRSLPKIQIQTVCLSSGFLNLNTIDTWDQIILSGEGLSRTI